MHFRVVRDTYTAPGIVVAVDIHTPLVNRAFSFFLWPLLGLILLPFTTMIYVLVYVPHIGVVGWNWLWIILGFFLDLAAYAGSGYSNRNRFPAMSRYPS